MEKKYDLMISIHEKYSKKNLVMLLQLMYSLLVAQLPERWCTSLVAQCSIPGMSRAESAITRGKNHAAATYQVFVNYILKLKHYT
jgi:hypothetical protein